MLIFRGLTVFFCISASVSSKKRFEDLLGICGGKKIARENVGVFFGITSGGR